jgi:hypothetical protein
MAYLGMSSRTARSHQIFHERDEKGTITKMGPEPFWPQKAEKVPVPADRGNFPLVHDETVTIYVTMQ